MNSIYESKKLKQGFDFVVGCDEVGRGCLAGPVVAAAVMLPQVGSAEFKVIKSCGIRDSKLLAPQKREELSEIILANCLAWGIGEVPSETIDEINIHHATLRAMRQAVDNLLKDVSCESRNVGAGHLSVRSSGSFAGTKEDVSPLQQSRNNYNFFLYVDGKFKIPNLSIKQEAVVDGDNKILSVAATSIVAKVYRDRLMSGVDSQYPEYGFARHKGYGTFHHREAIKRAGLSPIHRRSFCGKILKTP